MITSVCVKKWSRCGIPSRMWKRSWMDLGKIALEKIVMKKIPMKKIAVDKMADMEDASGADLKKEAEGHKTGGDHIGWTKGCLRR